MADSRTRHSPSCQAFLAAILDDYPTIDPAPLRQSHHAHKPNPRGRGAQQDRGATDAAHEKWLNAITGDDGPSTDLDAFLDAILDEDGCAPYVPRGQQGRRTADRSHDEWPSTITGDGPSTARDAFIAAVLREHNFNPDEPRDEWGRWTSEIPVAPELKPNQTKSYPVFLNKKQAGHVKVTLREPEGANLKGLGPGPGIHLEYEPDPKAEQRLGMGDVGWILHVVHLNVRKEDGKGVVEFEDPPRYDNGAANGKIGSASDPTKPVQPNEEDRPKDKRWDGSPWYGGPGSPDGTGPTGHSPQNPLPQSSLFDRPGSDISQGTGEQYIAQLPLAKGKGQVLFNYYYYVDNGKIHGLPMSPGYVEHIRMPK